MHMEKTRTRLIVRKVKNLLGAGPLLLLMGIFFEFLAVLIRRWFSFPVSLHFEAQVLLTIFCISICLLGMIWFHRSLNLVKVNLLNGEKKLITHGPFCYVRHPLYATLLHTLPPLMIIWFSDLLFILPWIIIVISSHYTIRLEERGLIREFGDEYEDYRRFVPSLVPYKGAGGRRFREYLTDLKDAE